MPTVSWSSLPKELLSIIFKECFETSDLLQLQLVCKSWSFVAYEQLYYHIITDKRTSSLLAHTLEHSKYQPRFFVKGIELAGSLFDEEEPDIDSLYTLVPLCPNLTHVIADEDMLCNTLYLCLLEMHQRGCLQHLEYLPEYPYDKASLFRNLYNKAAMAMKNTLTQLYIVHNYDDIIDSQFEDDPEINMLIQLQQFPKMEDLTVIYGADELFYEADTFIDACSTTVKQMFITLINRNVSFARSQFPALDLGSVRASPHVKSLHIGVLELTARDLLYMAHKFTGLKQLIIEGQALEDGEAVDRMLADGLLSAQEYIDAFEWMISIKSFEIVNLPLAANIREMLAFWAKRPQLKAMTIAESSDDDPSGAATFSIMNTEGEVNGNETHFRSKEKGAWEMYVNIDYEEPTILYKETLKMFKGSTVEHIRLLSHTKMEEGSEIIGESFNYVMEHFTAIKEIDVTGAQLVSFHATTVHKTLAKLDFLCCSITSRALLQLSPHVCYIESLEFSIVTLLNDSANDDDFLIDMPQTSIGDVAVWHDNKKGFFVKVCKHRSSDTAQDTIQQYFMMNKDGKSELKEDFYNEILSNEEICSTYNIVVIRCADLKTLRVRSDRLDYSIDVDYIE